MTSGILVINFKRPVNFAVDRLGATASDYIGAARRDPDGRALRFALSRKVRLNPWSAGERFFVDLLPETGTAIRRPAARGDPGVDPSAPAMPSARRASRSRAAVQRKIPLVRVRVARQPTFTRYIFDLPDLIGVTTDRGKDKLTLIFAKALRFDLRTPSSPAQDRRLDRRRRHRRHLRGAVHVREANRLAHLPRGLQLRRRRYPDRGQAALCPRASERRHRSTPDVTAPVTVPAEMPSPWRQPLRVLDAAAATMPKVAAEEARPSRRQRSNRTRRRAAPLEPDRPVSAEIRRQGDNLRVCFPFASETPAAVFQRADTLWLVFDTEPALDIGAEQRPEPHRQ